MAVPFVSFGKNYDAVCADAAAYFGIDADEYEVHLEKGRVLNAAGEEVNGTFNVELDGQANGVYIIRAQKSFSRPWTIATIFHEFAHAAQHKYNLDLGTRTREQHAELLAFNTLWRSGYWWNATHMLFIHTLHLKPSDYLAPAALWTAVFTGAKTV